MRKLTLEYVEEYFEEQGCELLEDEYKNSHILMKYICNCGDISKICFSHFKRGVRCKKCGDKKQKHTLEYVGQYFLDNNCVLLEKEYVNANTLMKYRCSFGHISKIRFGNFQQGVGCRQCGREESSLTLEYVYNCFKEEGCELLEEEYINNKTKMKYRCICGDISEIQFSNFQQGQRCFKCGHRRKGEKRRLLFEYVDSVFEKNNCKLLEDKYVNSRTKMKYRCACGDLSEICFNCCYNGIRCAECAIKENSGENHYRWIKDRVLFEENKRFKQKCCGMLRKTLKKTYQKKTDRTHLMLGYYPEDLKRYIYGHLNWKNVKDSRWHLDHIFPIQAFLDYNIKDIKLINCLENLQPLGYRENISKSDNYNKDEFESWLKEKKVKF